MLCQLSPLPMTALLGFQPLHSLKWSQKQIKEKATRNSVPKLHVSIVKPGRKISVKYATLVISDNAAMHVPFTRPEEYSTNVTSTSTEEPTAKARPCSARKQCSRQSLQRIGGYQTSARHLEANRLLAAADHILARHSRQAKPSRYHRRAMHVACVNSSEDSRHTLQEVAIASWEYFIDINKATQAKVRFLKALFFRMRGKQ